MPPIRKPNAKITDMVSEDVVTTRQRTWAGWLDGCAAIEEAFVEGLLYQILSSGPPDRTVSSLADEQG